MSHALNVLFNIQELANILPVHLQAHKQPSTSLFMFLIPEHAFTECGLQTIYSHQHQHITDTAIWELNP